MAFQYLFAPTTQFQARTGANNTAGFLRVFYTQTDDRAVTYSDFGGTENEADIVLDNDGRAVVIVDDSKTYRLEVYGVNRNLLFTVDPLTAVGGGSGGASITKVISTDGTVGITVTSIGGMVTYDLSTSFEDKPSHWGNAISMISELDGTNDWVQIPTVSSVGTSLYDNGWTADKDTGYDIAASVEMPTGSNNAIYGIDVKCEFQVDGATVLAEYGRIDPTAPMDRVSFEWKGELTKGQKVDAKLYVKNGEAITLGLVGRALFNEECDGIIGNGSGATEYIPGEYIDISTANVISVTGVQPLSGMSAYAANSALSSYVPNSAFSSYSSTVGNTIVNIENNVSSLSSTVSGLTGTYIEQSASGMFAPSSVETSKLDNSASSTWYPMTGNPSGFLTAVPPEYATTGDVASAVSGKLDTSAFSGVSGNFVQNSSFTSYTASALTAIDNSISSIQSSMSSMSSNVSGKVDQSAMSAWIPYSALDYSGSAISGIGGSSLAGMGGGGADYMGIYPINVDNTAREIAVDSWPLVTDSTMTSYSSGDSSVIGVASGIFFSSLPVSAKVGNDSASYGLKSAQLRSQYDGVDVMPNEVRLWHNGFSASVDYSAIKKWDSAVDTVSANSASWGAIDSATVSAIASGYVTGKQDVSGMSAYAYESSNSAKLDKTAQVVTATATQLYASTAFLTSVNGAPVSASRASQAANASLANSAYYDGTGRLISSLPDRASVSAIASLYTMGKQDTLTFGYDASNKISSIDGSALAGGGGGGGAYTSPNGTIVVDGNTLEGTNSAVLTAASGGYVQILQLASLPDVTISTSPTQITYGNLPNTSTGGKFILDFTSPLYGGTLFISGRDSAYNTASASAELENGPYTASVPQGPIVNQIYAWTDGNWLHLGSDITASADPQVFASGVAKLAWESSVSSKLDSTAFSTVSASFLTAVPAGYATETYVDSSVSSKLDSSAFSAVSGSFLTAVPAGYASEAYVDSSVSGKQDSSAMSAYVPFSAISADENSAITSINGSSIGGGTQVVTATGSASVYGTGINTINGSSIIAKSLSAGGLIVGYSDPGMYITGGNNGGTAYYKSNELVINRSGYGETIKFNLGSAGSQIYGSATGTRGAFMQMNNDNHTAFFGALSGGDAKIELDGYSAGSANMAGWDSTWNTVSSQSATWGAVTSKMDSTAVQSAYASASATQATAQGVLYILIPDGV